MASDTHHDPTETSPLLPSSSAVSTGRTPTSSIPYHDRPRSPFFPYASILIGIVSLVADFGGSLVDTPEVRLLEMAVCRDYYRVHDPSLIGRPPLSYVDEEHCKVKEIQANLAYLRATKSLLMTIPGILLTVSYGRLADKIGRKPVMLMGMTGQVLAYFWVILVCYFHETFSTKLVLVSPVFLAIGGGARVMSAIMNTIVVDVSPENMRTTTFYLIGAAVLLTDIVALPVGSWLLSKDLWLPYKFSTPIILLAYPLLLALPETRPTTIKINASNERTEATMSFTQKIRQSLQAFAISKEITMCLAIIFLSAFSRQSGSLFIQYTSNLLHLSISTAGYIMSIKAFVALGVLIFLAGVTQFVEKRSETRPVAVDIWIARGSLIILAVGALVIGLSTNVASLITGSILTSSGNSVVQAMQGVIASFESISTMGQLYAGVALVELLAGLTGSLAFAKLFDLGLGMASPSGLGIPFYGSAILYVIASLLSFFLPTETGTLPT